MRRWKRYIYSSILLYISPDPDQPQRLPPTRSGWALNQTHAGRRRRAAPARLRALLLFEGHPMPVQAAPDRAGHERGALILLQHGGQLGQRDILLRFNRSENHDAIRWMYAVATTGPCHAKPQGGFGWLVASSCSRALRRVCGHRKAADPYVLASCPARMVNHIKPASTSASACCSPSPRTNWRGGHMMQSIAPVWDGNETWLGNHATRRQPLLRPYLSAATTGLGL